jgi:hypothetical protein
MMALVGTILLVLASFVAGLASAQTPSGPAPQGVGLMKNEPQAYQGYTLISPLQSTQTFLLDMQGRVVHSWNAGSTPSSIAYLLENGHLLRAGVHPDAPFKGVAGGGGRIQEFDWNGALVWDFTYFSDHSIPHHDFVRLPNGNVILVTKERVPAAEAIALGRVPASVDGGELQFDNLVEIKPTGKTTGEVVWEWRLRDHLIQDFDRSKPNFGDVAAHPERADLNFAANMLLTSERGREALSKDPGDTALGDLPGRAPRKQRVSPDWTHVNGVAYNAELDQVVISVLSFNEVWILDHSTTTAEARTDRGGRSGKGGDILYRWGNPQAHRAGAPEDQVFVGQHNAHWIAEGLEGAGHLLVFNNGYRRRNGEQFSSVDELVLPVDDKGAYSMGSDRKFGPQQVHWRYTAPNSGEFYSSNISGAMRLPNGNTLITAGAPGILFEVTQDKRVVWQYNAPAFVDRPNGRNIFRAYRYGVDYPGLAGRQLKAGKALAELAGQH